MRPSPSQNTLNRIERDTIVIWKKPITTIYYALMEIANLAVELFFKVLSHKFILLGSFIVIGLCIYGYHAPGAHQEHVQNIEKHILWWSWWVLLGVLSSIGLGSGLHTFLIYLGPHIAAVTMAAYECQSLDFPEPPYPERLVVFDWNLGKKSEKTGKNRNRSFHILFFALFQHPMPLNQILHSRDILANCLESSCGGAALGSWNCSRRAPTVLHGPCRSNLRTRTRWWGVQRVPGADECREQAGRRSEVKLRRASETVGWAQHSSARIPGNHAVRLYPEPLVRPGRYHLRPFPRPVLVLLRSNSNWKSNC